MWDIRGVCSYYSFLSLCHSLNLLWRDSYFWCSSSCSDIGGLSVCWWCSQYSFKRNYTFTDLSLYFWPCQTFSVLENQDFYTWWHQEAFCWASTLMVSRCGCFEILWILNQCSSVIVPDSVSNDLSVVCSCLIGLMFEFCIWMEIMYLQQAIYPAPTVMDVTYNENLVKTHILLWSEKLLDLLEKT